MLAERTYRSRVLNLARTRRPDDEDLLAARRDLTYCHLTLYAQQATGDNPLRPDQIETVVGILTAGSGRRVA